MDIDYPNLELCLRRFWACLLLQLVNDLRGESPKLRKAARRDLLKSETVRLAFAVLGIDYKQACRLIEKEKKKCQKKQ